MAFHMEGVRILKRIGIGENQTSPSVNVQKFHCYGCSLQFKDLDDFKKHKCKKLRPIQNVSMDTRADNNNMNNMRMILPILMPMEIETETEMEHKRHEKVEEEEEASLTDVEMDIKPGEDELGEDPLKIPSTTTNYNIPNITTTTTTTIPTGTGILTNNKTNNPIVFSNNSTKKLVIARGTINPQSTVVKAALMNHLNRSPLEQAPPQLNQKQQPQEKEKGEVNVPTNNIQIVNSYSLKTKTKRCFGGVDKVNMQCKTCSSDFSSLKLLIDHLKNPCLQLINTAQSKKIKQKTKQTQTPPAKTVNSSCSTSTTLTTATTSSEDKNGGPESESEANKNDNEKDNNNAGDAEPSKLPPADVRCFGCDENFKSMQVMRLHLSPANRVKCPRCDDHFDLYCSLRKHIDQHAKEDAAIQANTKEPPAKTYSRKIPTRPVRLPVLPRLSTCAPAPLKKLTAKDTEILSLKQYKKLKAVKNNNNNNSSVLSEFSEPSPASPLATSEPEEEEEPEPDKSTFPFPCPRETCTRGFSLELQLKNHVHGHAFHDRTYPFKCPYCPIGFRKKKQLTAHKINVHDAGFNCPHNCSRIFAEQFTLDQHMQKYHSPGSQFKPPPQKNNIINSNNPQKFQSWIKKTSPSTSTSTSTNTNVRRSSRRKRGRPQKPKPTSEESTVKIIPPTPGQIKELGRPRKNPRAVPTLKSLCTKLINEFELKALKTLHSRGQIRRRGRPMTVTNVQNGVFRKSNKRKKLMFAHIKRRSTQAQVPKIQDSIVRKLLGQNVDPEKYPYPCLECPKPISFLRQEQLEQHKMLHRSMEKAVREAKMRVEGVEEESEAEEAGEESESEAEEVGGESESEEVEGDGGVEEVEGGEEVGGGSEVEREEVEGEKVVGKKSETVGKESEKVGKGKGRVVEARLKLGLLQCPNCPAPIFFPNKSFLLYHIKKFHNITDPQLAGITIQVTTTRNPNKNKNKKEFFSCQHRECIKLRPPVIYKTRPTLIKHKADVHGEEDTRPKHQCPHCPVILRGSKNSLKIHIERIHEKKKNVLCETCGVACYSLSTLQKHELTHSDVRSFKCDIDNCGKLFKAKHTLDKHKKTHGERKFLCIHCGRAFMTMDSMNVHSRLHSDEKLFKCPIFGCDVGYNHKVTLKAHMKTHPDWEGQL